MKLPEILAPAGSMETLRAALRAGANAVYIGGKRFSARSSATNFSLDEIAEAAKLCHKYGAKLDLAVNTIVSDGEAEDFCDYIKAAAKCGSHSAVEYSVVTAQVSVGWFNSGSGHDSRSP